MYTVEYSPSQRCMHLDELDRVIEINLRKFITKQENDWMLIGVFKTEKEASEFCTKATNLIRSRGE